MTDYIADDDNEALKRFGGREGVLARISHLAERLEANRKEIVFLDAEIKNLERLLAAPQPLETNRARACTKCGKKTTEKFGELTMHAACAIRQRDMVVGGKVIQVTDEQNRAVAKLLDSILHDDD